MSERVIIHVDLNAFFASVEQTANPFLRGKPVGVGANHPGAAILAASYAAKKRGVRGIMRVRDALIVCPELILVPFDPLKYYAVNQKIMKIFKEYTPQIEIYSIDEAFLDMTDVMHLYKQTPREIAQEIKDRIRSEIGEPLTSSVGIAPNKLLAKVGSDWKKPDGLTEITWENRFEYLDKVPIQDIWGIGYHAGPKLIELGVNSTKQIRELSDETLRSIVGSYYTRLRAIANGEHFDPVDAKRHEKAAKSMQHAHTMSKATNDPTELKSIIRKMSERLAIRLRKHKQQARVVYLGLRPEKMQTYGWGSLPKFSGFQALPLSTTHGKDIYDAAIKIFDDFDFGETKIRLIAVGVNDLNSASKLAFDIFMNPKITSLDKAVDEVNGVYGSFTVRYGDILHQKAKDSELKVERPNMTFHPTSE